MRWRSLGSIIEELAIKHGSLNIGDEKHVSKFLFLPKCIDNEWRWLERAEYIKRWSTHPSGYRYYWENIRWVD